MQHSAWKVLFTLKVFLVLIFLFSQPALAGKEVRYTKVNVHSQSKDGKTAKASYANYTNPGAGHIIVPAGTQIVVTKKGRKQIVFTYDDGGKKVLFEFHKPRMGMSVNEYLDLITSLEPVSFDHLSTLDKQGIADGKATVGMTREGVMAALGYPATHKTPSLDSSTWIYWTNRFGTVAVDFDDQGKVNQVRD